MINELTATELVAACDLASEKLDLLRRRLPGVTLTTSVEEVLADDSIEAVVVSTPTSTHADLTEAAADAGKHVLCEKPLATSVSDCDRVIRSAERSNVVLMVGHTFVFNPAVERMRDLVGSGEIGEVLYCHAKRTGLGPIRGDVNALWDLAPHDLSIIFELTGREAVEVTATGGSYLREEVEDVVFVTMRLENGVLANLHVSWLDPYKVRELTVIGAQRMVVFNDVAADEKLRVFDKGASYEAMAAEARGTDYGEYRAIVREGDILIPKVATNEPLKEQMSHFATCCRLGQRPRTDGLAGRRVVAALEAASESLRRRGAPVALSPALAPSR